MKINRKTTCEQLAAVVTEKLKEHGLSAVLVGGAVVSIYTENKYASHDLDFISPDDHSEIAAAMLELGFTSKSRGFAHPATGFSVEFPKGPIAIGNLQPVKPEGKLRVGKTTILLLSPTQSVMDRLAWFYHSNDRQCLDQAVMIAEEHPIKVDVVKKWSMGEGSIEKFEVFTNRLKSE